MNIKLCRIAILLAAILLFFACTTTGRENPVPLTREAAYWELTGRPRVMDDHLVFNFETHSIELNLKNLACLAVDRESRAAIIISQAAFADTAYRINETLTEIAYDHLGLMACVGFQNGGFVLELSAYKPCQVVWPSVAMEKVTTSLIWPHNEGSYIPLGNTVWTDFLKGRKWDTTADLYLPFWGIERDKRMVSYVFDNPFNNEIGFQDNAGGFTMALTHVFSADADLSRPIAFRVYLDTDASPIVPARYCRRYLEEAGMLVTLQEKMKIAPPAARLQGASHAYVWDGNPITIADVKPGCWNRLAAAIVNQAASPEPSAGKRIMTVLEPDKGNLDRVARQSAVFLDAQRSMANTLSRALRSARLYTASLWPPAVIPEPYRSIVRRIQAGEQVPEYEAVRLNSRLLYMSYPECLYPPATWGNGVSTRMIDALRRNKMDRFVLTSNGIENAEIRPETAAYAADNGYLFGPYDSYFEVQDPDDPQWTTAVFDRALFETGALIRADGNPVKGFRGIGYYMSPQAARPYFEKRLADNFHKVPHSYYFLDCDAFGQFFQDYRHGRRTSYSEDAAAREERVHTIFEKYRVPVGSEGGSYLFARSLAVAEGVFFPTVGFDDPDMELNEMSKYFLGRPFPQDEPERFFKPAVLQDRLVTLLSDPRFRLPLYEAVLHDCVIATSHYSSGSLKFSNIARTTALTEILYQVPPMYHFNLDYLEKIKDKIKSQVDVFGGTHSYSYRFPLEEFDFLTDDRLVQKTRFGALEVIANFREDDFPYQASRIPARSLLISFTDSKESFIYTPQDAYKTSEAQDTAGLLKDLSDPAWEKRQQAAETLSMVGVPAKAAVPSLIRNLQDQEWPVRAAAAKALANMENEAAPAVPGLITALSDGEWPVRRAAAYALAALGREAAAAVPALLQTLNDEEWHVRRPAAWALGCVGAREGTFIPALRSTLKDPEMQVRLAAEAALKKLGIRSW